MCHNHLDQIASAIESRWTLEDSGLHIELANEDQEWSIESDRVFIDSVIIDAVRSIDDTPSLILTYLANAMEANDRSTPYSFVSAGPFLNNDDGSKNDAEYH